MREENLDQCVRHRRSRLVPKDARDRGRFAGVAHIAIVGTRTESCAQEGAGEYPAYGWHEITRRLSEHGLHRANGPMPVRSGDADEVALIVGALPVETANEGIDRHPDGPFAHQNGEGRVLR